MSSFGSGSTSWTRQGTYPPTTVSIPDPSQDTAPRVWLRRAVAADAPAIGAVFDAAVGVGWPSLGHSSIQITPDRYGHLMPGNEDEAVALVDAYLARASGSGAHQERLENESR